MLADEVDYVVGVDTHRDEHVLAVVAAPTGAVVAQRSVAATRAATRRRVGSRLSTLAAAVSGDISAVMAEIDGLVPRTAVTTS